MNIPVQQALHGYSEGHRQLSSSIKLSPQDSKLVLVMSDVSGSGVASEGASYLTGYPLQDAGMYALARTWAAPEMPRPGCVWTQTLLIDYADLAALREPSTLDTLFVRPQLHNWATYARELCLPNSDSDNEPAPTVSISDEHWLTDVVSSLYEFPTDRVFASREPGVDVDGLSLKLWGQQWPRLRRAFRFCTHTTRDRSSSAASFDLQLMPPSTGTHRRLATAHSPTGSHRQQRSLETDSRRAEWLLTLLADIRAPNADGLRDTLKVLGAEVLGGREAMPTLCKFHRLTRAKTSSVDWHAAIELLEHPSPLSSSERARAEVADLVLENAQSADPRCYDFLWDNWQFIDAGRLSVLILSTDAMAAIWRSCTSRLLNDLQSAEADAQWAKVVIGGVPLRDLLNGWPAGLVPLGRLVAIRPDLLDEPEFWRVADIHASSDLEGTELSSVAVSAMLKGIEREGAMRAAVQFLGPLRVLHALQAGAESTSWEASVLRWVRYCVWDSAAIAQFLSGVDAPSAQLLAELTHLINPDTVPNQYGDDPWYTALIKLRTRSSVLPTRLAAFAFARALGWSSRNIAELLSMTFEGLHLALAGSGLDSSDWDLIEPRLPWVRNEHRWDRAGRLRLAVAATFLERRLWPRAFAWMADDNGVFAGLMEAATTRYGGKRFLRSVAHSLDGEHDAASSARRALILAFLRDRD